MNGMQGEEGRVVVEVRARKERESLFDVRTEGERRANYQTSKRNQARFSSRHISLSPPSLCHISPPRTLERLIIQRGLFFGDFPEINNHPILSWKVRMKGGALNFSLAQSASREDERNGQNLEPDYSIA